MERTRRRAVIQLDERLLAPLLQLPDDMRVLGSAFDPASLAVMVHVECERLPEAEEGRYLPIIAPQIHVEADPRRDELGNLVGWRERVVSVDWPLPTVAVKYQTCCQLR